MLAHFEHPALIAQYAQLGWYLIPVLVLVASLLGSTHCLGMCGGIVMALPPERKVHVAYHAGRLLGYLGLGAIAGAAGDWLLASSGLLTTLSALLMATILIWSAIKVWRGQALHLQLPAWFSRLIQKPLGLALTGARRQGWLGLPVGLLTMFLPCGWLYTFVLGALLTRNLWLGALFLFSFWLGTIPLLALGPSLVNSWLSRRSPAQRHWVAALFLLAGLLTIAYKSALPLPVGANQLKGLSQDVASCHQVQDQRQP
ncbi:MAG TPA: sulfite exporter TauE/SafE family protein [Candidatus Obscuribacterales bacterium]